MLTEYLDSNSLVVLSEVYDLKGQMALAKKTAEKAVEVAIKNGNYNLVEESRKHPEKYQSAEENE